MPSIYRPLEVWLRDDIDDGSFFPQDDSGFHLHENSHLAPYANLIVEGPAEEHIVSSSQYCPSTGPIASLASTSYTMFVLVCHGGQF